MADMKESEAVGAIVDILELFEQPKRERILAAVKVLLADAPTFAAPPQKPNPVWPPGEPGSR